MGPRSPRRRGIPAAIALLLLAASPPPGRALDGYSPSPFRPGEVLRYHARWKFIPLGTVVIEQHAAADAATGAGGCELHMIVDSDTPLPFVDVHFANRSLLSSHDPANRSFAYDARGDDALRVRYRSPSPDGALFIGIYQGDRTVLEDSLSRRGPVYDAGGLFMAARCLAASGLYVTVPTIVDRAIRPTRLRFTGEVKRIRVPAFPRGVAARRIQGDADWATGSCAGLTGRFSGWVTADERAIPLKINMEIALGSVVLELDSTEGPPPAPPVMRE